MTADGRVRRALPHRQQRDSGAQTGPASLVARPLLTRPSPGMSRSGVADTAEGLRPVNCQPARRREQVQRPFVSRPAPGPSAGRFRDEGGIGLSMHQIANDEQARFRSMDRCPEPRSQRSVDPSEPALDDAKPGGRPTRREVTDHAFPCADRFGLSSSDWTRAVEQTIARSTREQGLPMTIDDDRALTAVANIIAARSKWGERQRASQHGAVRADPTEAGDSMTRR